MSFDVHIVTIPLPTTLADDALIPALKAPTDLLGGGLRLLYAQALEMASGQGAGTAYQLQLFKYSSAGTPAVNGTISTAAVGGTASPLAAGVPQAFTLNSTYSHIDAGEWVMIRYDEIGAATNPAQASVTIGYVMGK